MVEEEEMSDTTGKEIFPGVVSQPDVMMVKDDVTQSPPLVLPSILQRRRNDRSKQAPMPLCPLR